MQVQFALTVPAIRDRVVQGALKLILEPIFEADFPRDWRNRKLAHTELPAHLGGLARSLPNVTSAQIEDAHKSFRDLLWSIDQHYGLPPSASMGDPFGARSLIGYLELAVQAHEAEKQHWLDMAKEMDARRSGNK